MNRLFRDNTEIDVDGEIFHEKTELVFAFHNRVSYQGSYGSVLSTLYPLAVFHDFLPTEEYSALSKVLFSTVSFHPKHSDLYDFSQSSDLQNYLHIHQIHNLRQLMLERVRPLAETMIGKSLDPQILDLSAQIYQPGEYLLVHDDRLEGRRVAFVLYLVSEDWAESDGGHLEFLPTNWNGDPYYHPHRECSGQLFLPRANTLVFFEVGLSSHHQVCQVAGQRARISISGWFHDVSVEQSKEFSQSSTTLDLLNQSQILHYGRRGILLKDSLPHDLFNSLTEQHCGEGRHVISPYESFYFYQGADNVEPLWCKFFQSPSFKTQICRLVATELNFEIEFFGRPRWKEYRLDNGNNCDYRMRQSGLWRVLVIVTFTFHQRFLRNAIIITGDDFIVPRGACARLLEIPISGKDGKI